MTFSNTRLGLYKYYIGYNKISHTTLILLYFIYWYLKILSDIKFTIKIPIHILIQFNKRMIPNSILNNIDLYLL